jgi:large subunit ribosomal protein L22
VTGPKTNEREGTRAFLRGAPISAFKVRPVLDLIRGEDVGNAADILRFCERGPAEAVGKLLASAIANAAANDDLDPEELFVAACYADESKTMRRMRPRARGRASRIRKRSAHITIIVSRLPEDRLARLRAERAAEQASRRARRGARGPAAPGDRARRTGRRGAATEAAAPDELAAEGVTADELASELAVDEAVAEAVDTAPVVDVEDDSAVVEAAAGEEPAEDATSAPTGEAPPSEADHEHGSTE